MKEFGALHRIAVVAATTFALALSPALGSAGSKAEKVDQTVVLQNINFHPDRIRVSVGDRVRFVNRDPFEHDVYLVRAANPNIVLQQATTLAPGASVTLTIREKGLFNLYCTIHGGMSGKLSTTGSFELSKAEQKKFASTVVLPPIVKTGEQLFWGPAQCHQCHRIGERGTGLRGPNLQSIGFRAAVRAKKRGLESGTAYIVQSILEPPAYVVDGYSNDMIRAYQEPVGLGKEEIRAVVAYLQSQGGKVDTWAIDIDEGKLASKPRLNPFASGDAARGKEVFEQTGCASCHNTPGHKAISIGPDLSVIGSFRNWTWLAESIIHPSEEVGANWQSATVYLKSGDVASGVLRKRSPTEVVLLVGQDRYQTIPVSEVDEVQRTKESRMPANFPELLTFEQFSDLIAYLESLKGPGPSGG